jgi:hypothetical protein
MKRGPLAGILSWTKSSHNFGRDMTKKILWVLVLVFIGCQSGCALEKYQQISADHTGTKYSHDDALSGPQFGPAPG